MDTIFIYQPSGSSPFQNVNMNPSLILACCQRFSCVQSLICLVIVNLKIRHGRCLAIDVASVIAFKISTFIHSRFYIQ